MPAPVSLLLPAEAEALLRRAATARGWRWGDVRGTGGFLLEVTGGGSPERLVWATFGKQAGLLALFSGEKMLATLEKGLGEILRVQPLALPGLPQFALMVDDRYDEMVGAFLREARRRIYVWDGRGLREIYQGMLESEQFVHAQWENPRGPNAWRLRRTLSDVALQDGLLTESQRLQELEAPGAAGSPLPAAKAFRLLKERRQEKRLTWNARLRRFQG